LKYVLFLGVNPLSVYLGGDFLFSLRSNPFSLCFCGLVQFLGTPLCNVKQLTKLAILDNFQNIYIKAQCSLLLIVLPMASGHTNYNKKTRNEKRQKNNYV
jgi:hypothetical protein